MSSPQTTAPAVSQTPGQIPDRIPNQTLRLPYPPARTVEQVDDYFGTAVRDPYRWMEDVDSAEVKTWVDAENALTQSYLAEVPVRAALRDRILHLNSFERYTLPSHRGTRYFYTHNQGLQNQNVVFWQEGLGGAAKVLLDPNMLAADGTVALSGFAVTDDGALAAYALSEAGSDWLTWHVREVASGRDLPDVVHWSKFSNASWAQDGSGFFYSAFDPPQAAAQDVAGVAAQPGAGGSTSGTKTAEDLKASNYFHKLYFHKLGTAQSADALIFERPDDKELTLNGEVTDDGRYLLIAQAKSASNNELTILPLNGPDPAHPAGPPIRLVPKADAAYTVIASDGAYLWIQTTLDAPNGKVLGVDLNHPERSAWTTLVPETHNTLDSVAMVDDTLILTYLADAQSHVELHARDGKLLQTLPLPAIGTTGGFTGRRTDRETFFSFTNFTTPPTIYRMEMKTRAASVYREPKLLFTPAEFETRQVFARSKDGTRVPIFLSYRKGLKLDGSAPTLLYAYGGFNISLVPSFAPSRIAWMEMGGIYAQAVLRGGGEYGESWHLAGTGVHKQNVFDDYIACAEYLIAHKYTSAPKLAIQGGSNGGLLVGAVELQRPELFGAALPDVGVMDMLRFDKFTIGWAWKADYGSPSGNQAEFEAIYKYSPLHNVRAGVAYPPTLITTADHDDRVFPAHSFKFAAAMQAAVAGPLPAGAKPAGPVLIRIETRAGHGSATPLAKRVEAVADQFAFLVRALGMTPALP